MNRKNNREMLIIATILVISGLVYYKFFSENKQISVIKKEVSNLFKDPESTKFKDIKNHILNKKNYFCGKVNSKNSYGAYIGYRKFMASNVKGIIYIENDNNSTSKSWLNDPNRDNKRTIDFLGKDNDEIFKILWEERCN